MTEREKLVRAVNNAALAVETCGDNDRHRWVEEFKVAVVALTLYDGRERVKKTGAREHCVECDASVKECLCPMETEAVRLMNERHVLEALTP